MVLLLWGMFVKTTRRRRGDKVYEYLSLVETVRKGSKIGHRTLLRLGEVTALRESGQLGRIIAALERHLHKQRVDVEGMVAEGAPAVGAVAARLRCGNSWVLGGSSPMWARGEAPTFWRMRCSRWWRTGWWPRVPSVGARMDRT